jgi:predicted flap endonuclease-1-like 5' DNA nuclease
MSPKLKTYRNIIQPRDWSIEQLPGLSDRDRSKLEELGIATTRQLLEKANTPQSRQVLANQLQIKSAYVNKWVALADLARVPGIGCQHCGLVLHAGISSVSQLAQTPAYRLHQQILRLQVATMQRRDLCPHVEEVAAWIKQARELAVKGGMSTGNEDRR